MRNVDCNIVAWYCRLYKKLNSTPRDGTGYEFPTFHWSFETGDARAFDEDMRETSGRSLDSRCMAARGPSYRAALENVFEYTSAFVVNRENFALFLGSFGRKNISGVIDKVGDACVTEFFVPAESRGFAGIVTRQRERERRRDIVSVSTRTY